jgi:hypothetical protein
MTDTDVDEILGGGPRPPLEVVLENVPIFLVAQDRDASDASPALSGQEKRK